MSLQPRSSLGGSGPPPNANFVVKGRRFIGRGDPNGRVAGYVGDEYLDLDTGGEWHKMTGDPRRETLTEWEPESENSAAEAQINILIAAAKTEFFPLTMAELTAIPSNATNRYARVKDDGEGNSRGFWWDDDTVAPDVEPDDFDGDGGWVFDSI